MPGVLCSQVCRLFGTGHTFCALYRHFVKSTWAAPLLDQVDQHRNVQLKKMIGRN